MSEQATVSFDGWVCPMPLRDSPAIVMGHGGGGAMSAELVEHLFLPAYGDAADATLGDSAVVSLGGARLAFSTDSYVVRPLFFPGGSIGDLAVNGTVNDLSMSGATPLVLSTAFILEEGTQLTDLGRVAEAVGSAARAAGVRLVTGDTKVVDAGHGDGVFINTAGIGVLADRQVDHPRTSEGGPSDDHSRMLRDTDSDHGGRLPELVTAHRLQDPIGVLRSDEGHELALVGDIQRVEPEQTAGVLDGRRDG